MIVDRIQNAAQYYAFGDRISSALRFLYSNDFAKMESGRHEIRGRQIFAMVQRYTPRPPEGVQWEAHRDYIDVQYVVSGVEQMGYAPMETLTTAKAYDKESDAQMLTGPGSFITAMPGMFFILAPDDAHMPAIALPGGDGGEVTKVVVKVAVT